MISLEYGFQVEVQCLWMWQVGQGDSIVVSEQEVGNQNYFGNYSVELKGQNPSGSGVVSDQEVEEQDQDQLVNVLVAGQGGKCQAKQVESECVVEVECFGSFGCKGKYVHKNEHFWK